MSKDLLFPYEPGIRWDLSDFKEYVVWASEIGASDIKIVPGTPMWMRLDGQWQRAGKRALNTNEVTKLVNETAAAADAADQALSGDGYDYRFEVRKDLSHVGSNDYNPHAALSKRFRFRANASGCSAGLGSGVAMTMRSIPETPPSIHDINVPQTIVDSAAPSNGLVLVVGTMGSGKSTLIASLLRHINETYPWSIRTFEHPIEYNLRLTQAVGPVVQTEIPGMFTAFRNAARNATRCAEDVVLMGESRDRETVDSMLEMAEIGSLVYTTMHTRSAAGSPDRMINLFPENERSKVAIRFASAIRLIVYQRLLPRMDPDTGRISGRVPIIEYLPVTTAMNAELQSADYWRYREILERYMAEGHGRTLNAHADELLGSGAITRDVYDAVIGERRHVA